MRRTGQLRGQPIRRPRLHHCDTQRRDGFSSSPDRFPLFIRIRPATPATPAESDRSTAAEAAAFGTISPRPNGSGRIRSETVLTRIGDRSYHSASHTGFSSESSDFSLSSPVSALVFRSVSEHPERSSLRSLKSAEIPGARTGCCGIRRCSLSHLTSLST